MSNDNYPPGVSERDIERHFGDECYCEDCGQPIAYGRWCKPCKREQMADMDQDGDPYFY